MDRTRLLACLLVLVTTLPINVEADDDVDSAVIDHPRDPYHFHDYRDHPCKRPCKKDAPPMTCHYYFLLEHYTTMSAACHGCPSNQTECSLQQCVPSNGKLRGILTVNRLLPGPVIDVCAGDTVVVLLDNRMEMGQGTSIHWHGLRQVGSPHMDGTNLVTQCPIHAHSKMTYRFKAADPGTHFWHSHSSIQRSDGLFGGLIVRTPYNEDPHRHLYDYDLPEHYILLSDWTNKSIAEVFPQDMHGAERAVPSSILINGLGSSQEGPAMPYPVFKVKAGRQYRFRMAYNGILNCPIYVTVDDHSLLMIASDGHNFEPLEVDAFMIFSGERYDFILQAKHEVSDNFWIRFKAHGRCPGVFQAAILRYDGANESTPTGVADYNNTVECDNMRILNGLSGVSRNTSFQVVDLVSIDGKDDDVLTRKPNKQFYITLAASELEDERFKPPVLQNQTTDRPPPVRPITHQLNYITSQLPPSPPLTQFKDIPQDQFCNNDTVTGDCSQVFCTCIHLLKFDIGDIVEIVLVSFTNTLVHPMHMHGHSFRVVAMKTFGHDLTVAEVKVMDKKGQIARRTSHATYKDTISVHAQSVVIIRFRSTNPGYWFFHCHIEFHSELGMALILQAGKPHEMPKPPKGFPTCGNWRPHNDNKLEKQQEAATERFNDSGKILGAAIGSVVAIVVIVVIMCVAFQSRGKLQEGAMNKRLIKVDSVRYQRI